MGISSAIKFLFIVRNIYVDNCVTTGPCLVAHEILVIHSYLLLSATIFYSLANRAKSLSVTYSSAVKSYELMPNCLMRSASLAPSDLKSIWVALMTW